MMLLAVLTNVGNFQRPESVYICKHLQNHRILRLSKA